MEQSLQQGHAEESQKESTFKRASSWKSLIIILVIYALCFFVDYSVNVFDKLFAIPAVATFVGPDDPGDNSFLPDMLIFLTPFAVLALAWIIGQMRLMRFILGIALSLATLYIAIVNTVLVYTLGQYQSKNGSDLGALVWNVLLIWFMIMVIFAAWYWFLDLKWGRRNFDSKKKELVFPQQADDFHGWDNWKPGVFDYLFLAFNTNTTFGPTDVVVLSQRAKFFMVLQTVLALLTFGVAFARITSMIGG
ncbi:DUF1345 domain-containing protein [Ktedonospora formicarum]|uniref:DUF1345 domain-containing protein n=1 Tax=Ktedonospora formicarum TaxID=2778364 RepID=A0A8J3MY93_9CHLR|nr:DUF1345 domain-containing protein [Ktedonospora formicarum]GHO49415.1 hypothetical protein KSX_75780 [Ktedonospora formicarum]